MGRELVAAFEGHDVVAARHADLDVGDRDAVLQAMDGLRPEVVVHAAAWTAVDACEADPDRAYRVNALGTRHVAEGARRHGSHLCLLSTDYVFDGRKKAPYVEWDEPNPVSTYGRSKLAGERELGPGATVVRTSWVCGRHGSNIVKAVLALAGRQERLAFVDDQRGNPTLATDLAGMVRRLVVGRLPGVFHVTNQGAVTWYEVARAVMEAARLDPDRVEPVASSDLDPPQPAPRPANSVLDNAALRLSGIPLLPHHGEGLVRLVAGLVR